MACFSKIFMFSTGDASLHRLSCIMAVVVVELCYGLTGFECTLYLLSVTWVRTVSVITFAAEVMACVYLDNKLVKQTDWKAMSQQCWDLRFTLDLDRVWPFWCYVFAMSLLNLYYIQYHIQRWIVILHSPLYGALLLIINDCIISPVQCICLFPDSCLI